MPHRLDCHACGFELRMGTDEAVDDKALSRKSVSRGLSMIVGEVKSLILAKRRPKERAEAFEGLISGQSRLHFKKLDWLHYVLLVIVLILGFFLWLTPYQYHRGISGYLVRTHRLSGKAELLTFNGWRPMQRRE